MEQSVGKERERERERSPVAGRRRNSSRRRQSPAPDALDVDGRARVAAAVAAPVAALQRLQHPAKAGSIVTISGLFNKSLVPHILQRKTQVLPVQPSRSQASKRLQHIHRLRAARPLSLAITTSHVSPHFLPSLLLPSSASSLPLSLSSLLVSKHPLTASFHAHHRH